MKQYNLRMGFSTKEDALEFIKTNKLCNSLLNAYTNNYIGKYVEILRDNSSITWMVPEKISLNTKTNTFQFIGTGFSYETKTNEPSENTYIIATGFLDIEYNPVYPDPSVISQDTLVSVISSSKDLTDDYKKFALNIVVNAYNRVNKLEDSYADEDTHVEPELAEEK